MRKLPPIAMGVPSVGHVLRGATFLLDRLQDARWSMLAIGSSVPRREAVRGFLALATLVALLPANWPKQEHGFKPCRGLPQAWRT